MELNHRKDEIKNTAKKCWSDNGQSMEAHSIPTAAGVYTCIIYVQLLQAHNKHNTSVANKTPQNIHTELNKQHIILIMLRGQQCFVTPQIHDVPESKSTACFFWPPDWSMSSTLISAFSAVNVTSESVNKV